MLADKGTEVSLPNEFPAMVEGSKEIMLRFVPHRVNTGLIHRWCGGRKAIEGMVRKGFERKIAFPKQPASHGKRHLVQSVKKNAGRTTRQYFF